MSITRPVRRLVAAMVISALLFFVIKTKITTKSNYDNGLKYEPLVDREYNFCLLPYVRSRFPATGEPEGHLWRAEGDSYAPDNPNSSRINATLLSLVRNSELEQLLMTMGELEETFNSKFNYPWTFFNDDEFTEEFKNRTQSATKATCHYGMPFPWNRFLSARWAIIADKGAERIPKEHWAPPDFIDMRIFQESVDILKSHDVQYSDKLSYHQMCRWNSGMFYKHPALKDTHYYWRVEPNVHYFCHVDYDVFRYMQDRNKTYGFVINLYDSPDTLPNLWPETLKFMGAHSEYVHPNNAMDWLVDGHQRPEHNRKANGYSTCHFWSNFEIGSLDFFRSKAYDDYFNHLDHVGGFFYERWGDAPVHSIALGLFEDKEKIHWYVFVIYLDIGLSLTNLQVPRYWL